MAELVEKNLNVNEEEEDVKAPKVEEKEEQEEGEVTRHLKDEEVNEVTAKIDVMTTKEQDKNVSIAPKEKAQETQAADVKEKADDKSGDGSESGVLLTVASKSGFNDRAWNDPPPLLMSGSRRKSDHVDTPRPNLNTRVPFPIEKPLGLPISSPSQVLNASGPPPTTGFINKKASPKTKPRGLPKAPSRPSFNPPSVPKE